MPAILNPFAEGAAPAVMTRIALDWMVDGPAIDALLDEVSEGQYSREILLRHFVEVMADVACGFRKSAHAAFLKRQLDHLASISAFYRKLNRMELVVTSALTRRTAERARDLIVASEGLMPEPVPGYAARVLDGNILTGTDHRIEVLRTTRSAALPGMSLAVHEPASGMIRDVVLEENDHTQERALFDQVVWVDDPEQEGRRYQLRRIVLVLDQSSRDGDSEIVLITNLPETVSAVLCRRLIVAVRLLRATSRS